MQETRSHILSFLKTQGSSSVDQIVAHLRETRGPITHVTIRHHLARLLSEGLVTSTPLARSTPGRPQLIYRLTPQGESLFPNNFRLIAEGLIEQVKQTLPEKQANVIFEGLGVRLAQAAIVTSTTMPERLEQVVAYLNQLGYDASWELSPEGYLLHTYSCPYHRTDHDGSTLCRMDMALMANLLGVVPRLVRHMAQGDRSCSYLIPIESN
ncbi:ArsR family transcriptional regulator [Aggregatilineales bacterium SYSU G02658]